MSSNLKSSATPGENHFDSGMQVGTNSILAYKLIDLPNFHSLSVGLPKRLFPPPETAVTAIRYCVCYYFIIKVTVNKKSKKSTFLSTKKSTLLKKVLFEYSKKYLNQKRTQKSTF